MKLGEKIQELFAAAAMAEGGDLDTAQAMARKALETNEAEPERRDSGSMGSTRIAEAKS